MKYIKYGLSLGKKIKAAKIDNIDFANKVLEWGVNYICTNKLESFLIKNEKEEPIIMKDIAFIIPKIYIIQSKILLNNL